MPIPPTGLAYYFKIVATNIVGDSFSSTDVGTIAAALPDAPFSPTLVAASNLPSI